MQDLKRIHYVAGHYNALRGLKLLPVGLGLIIYYLCERSRF